METKKGATASLVFSKDLRWLPFVGGTLFFRHYALDVAAHHAYALDVVAALRYDDVGETLGRFYELVN